MNRYWISWYEKSEDYRPLNFPPNNSVKGWWKSGESDDASILCAVVDAENEDKVWESIEIDWPGSRQIRFCEIRKSDYKPGDRFPVSDWMKDRL